MVVWEVVEVVVVIDVLLLGKWGGVLCMGIGNWLFCV